MTSNRRGGAQTIPELCLSVPADLHRQLYVPRQPCLSHVRVFLTGVTENLSGLISVGGRASEGHQKCLFRERQRIESTLDALDYPRAKQGSDPVAVHWKTLLRTRVFFVRVLGGSGVGGTPSGDR